MKQLTNLIRRAVAVCLMPFLLLSLMGTASLLLLVNALIAGTSR